MMPDQNHPISEFFIGLSEYLITWHKGESFERAKQPPRWIRRLRLLTFPIWWAVTGLAACFGIGLMLLVLVAFEGLPVWIEKFKEAWDNA